MSYILEALKKAQAERQLGNAPSIHAPQPVQVNAAAGGASANRRPLLIGLGAGALVVLAGAALMWHRAPAPEGQKLAQAMAPATPSPPHAPAAAGAASATLAVHAPDISPPPVAPHVAAPHAVPVAPAPLPSTRAGADTRVARGAGAPVPAAVQPQMAPPPAQRQPAAPEDSLPYAQQLPEQIRSQIPHVAFGGYMYSANPADRLLLVDNALRHEGEEVAPGLVLEKLMPKAAVMNFRGIRYRVAY